MPYIWKIWFTAGIAVALLTALVACVTLVILPLKYTVDLLWRPSTNERDLSNNQSINARDQLLIQPLVCRRGLLLVCSSDRRI